MGPLCALLFLVWLGEHPPPAGRFVASAGLSAVVLLFIMTTTGRTFRIRVTPGSRLVWEEGLDAEDDYRVFVHTAEQRRLLLEHPDPARVLADLQRFQNEFGLPLDGPSWLPKSPNPAERQPRALPGEEVGQYWPYQTRAAYAVLGSALFILAVFGFSVRAEQELSPLSLVLPLATSATTALVGWFLLGLQMSVRVSAERLAFFTHAWGISWQSAEFAMQDLRAVRAVGHAGFAPQHLLIETQHGSRALRLSEELLDRVLKRLEPLRNQGSEPMPQIGAE
ncbi:MAG TPA: hypothetical protein VFQ61_02775 [Polyangiaceae bacterium]|nr:hypothetical protein [Polyangiaceae bacterium]